jgi:predicted dehydrogenase
MKKDRRKFIKKSTTLMAGAAFAPSVFSQHYRVAPSDTVNVALIGCRNMGFGILKRHLELPDVNVIGMCDVDQNILDERTAEVEKNYNQKPKKYNDFRKVLENKDLDAVIIGTPDHWHCLPMVYACQADKDVYVEKPMANYIEECNIMVEAANKYNRIVQVGQQQRSGRIWNDIMDYIKSGKLGTLRKVTIWSNFDYGVGRPVVPDQPVPEGVDFDFWLGPAPDRSFNPSRFHGSWRMFWDYGGGLMTDWGVHLLDMAFWAKDIKTPPQTVLSYGANLSFNDHAHETFDTMSVTFPMEGYMVSWEHTAGTQTGPWDKNYGMAFKGDKGTIVANRSGWEVIPEWNDEMKEHKTEAESFEKGRENHDLHVKNFIECVKSRNTPHCPPEIGRVVAIAAHMANIAVRSGDYKLDWNHVDNRFSNSKKANEYVKPTYRAPWSFPKI